MSGPGGLRALWAAFSGDQRKPTVILSVSTLALLSWKYFGSPDFYLQRLSPHLAPGADPGAAAAIYSFAACFLLLGLVPVLVVKLVFRERLADYGVQLGNRVRTLRSFLLLAPACVLVAYLTSRDPAMANEYPINRGAGKSAAAFALHAGTYLVYYLGWEFHFRGFLQCGLRGKLGAANALLIQVMASALMHIGKPAVESYAAVLGGILWGVIALRTRSLLSGLLQHASLGISLDWFLCFLRDSASAG
jgi:membrane protease YdiL (CAAX protease family)